MRSCHAPRSPRRLVSGLAAAFALAGCEATIRGEPAAEFDRAKPEAAESFEEVIVNAALDPARLRTLVTAGATEAERNRVIYARMAEIDALYATYERELTKELRESGFVGALAELAVDTAGALTGRQASQILSAISAGLTGAQTAVEKELLIDRTVQAFISHMRAGRSAVKRRILLKLIAPASAYPLEAAVSDLSAYRQAGTLTGALVGVAAAASEVEATRRADLNAAESAVIRGRFGETEDAAVLLTYIGTEDGVRTADERLLRLQSLFEGLPPALRAACPGGGLDGVLYTVEPGCRAAAAALVADLRRADGG